MGPTELEKLKQSLDEAQKAEASAKLKLDNAIAHYRATVSFTAIAWRDYCLCLEKTKHQS
jgi:hypothetical protein